MTTPSRLTRRHLLQSGLTIGAVSALGASALAGCSNEGRGSGGSQTENDAVQLPDYLPYEGVQPDLAGERGVSDGMLAYPADPVQATDGPPGDGQPISAFVLTNTPAPPALGNNSFWQGLNERLGFDLSLALVPSGDLSDRFQTTVAGDQLPDLFTLFPGEVPSLPGLLNKKAADLTPLLSGAAVAKYPFLANIPTDSWRQTVYGGKIFGIPIPRGPQSSATLYARKDLLDEYGLSSTPGSWQEFYDLCVELSAKKANKWALAALPMSVIRQMHGIPNSWSDADGGLVSANEAERQQEALEAGRKLVADKLVHPDSVGVQNQQRKTWVVNGTTMMMEGTFSGWPDFYNVPSQQEFTLTSIAPPRAEGGGAAQIWLAGPTHNVTSISIKATDRAEALLGFLNYLAAPFGTAEHLYKNYGEQGVHHDLEGTDPVLTGKGRSEAQLGLKYLAEGPWVNYQAGLPEVTQAQFDAQNVVVPDALPNAVLGLYSETQSRRGGQIGQALGTVESDILQGRKPVSAWAEAVATWKKNGGDTIRDEFQRALDERGGS